MLESLNHSIWSLWSNRIGSQELAMDSNLVISILFFLLGGNIGKESMIRLPVDLQAMAGVCSHDSPACCRQSLR